MNRRRAGFQPGAAAGRAARSLGLRGLAFFWFFRTLVPLCEASALDGDPAATRARLAAAAQEEIGAGRLSGVTLALVDDQSIAYIQGFGYADKKRRLPARPDTVYRAGSISKLFTAVAVMQMAEQGRLDLDRPVARLLPGFAIIDPFEDAGPVTLRQLMCHRSGLIRESPVGSYFDDSEPSQARCVASLASCALVYPPGTKTKYSNIGVTVAGATVAHTADMSFEAYQDQHVLGPLGMESSSFRLTRALNKRLAKGYLPVADGQGGFKEIVAPQFELGTVAAGNLYTTAEDIARFVSWLFAQGRAGERRLLKPATLEQMFTPQLTSETNGFGLGFSVGHVRGRKTVSHTGAVYGFTSSLVAMLPHKIGVIVLCNDDIATGPVKKLSDLALGLMLEAKTGQAAPAKPSPPGRTRAELSAFAGEYESESYWARLEAGDGNLKATVSGQSLTLAPTAALKFEATGRYLHEAQITFERTESGQVTGFSALGQRFRRVNARAAAPMPPAWQKFLGSYGPAFIPVIISFKHGHLYAMTENMFDYRLTPLNQTVFKMPPGLYTDEYLVFQPGTDGRVHSLVMANIKLPRRK